MIPAKSLALYKNRPVLVLESRDRLEIRLEDGSTLKVREKDLEALHPGPLSAIPAPAEGGDFDTAHSMSAPAEGDLGPVLPWAEVAELVFGSTGPGEILACWKEGLEGLRFVPAEGGLAPRSAASLAKEAEKRARKEGEAAERAAFVERAKAARAGKGAAGALPATFQGGDERFLAEIEAFARGQSSKCKLASEIGFAETQEAAHAYLLKCGRWTELQNPQGFRAGCSLHAPRIALEASTTLPERLDLRDLEAWAIDNAWSHDPDDAISYDGQAFWVHVADPAAFVLPDSAVDREALARGSTLYLPELTAPLLPDEALTRAGLGLAEESPALSFKILVDAEASIISVEALPTRLRVRRSHYAEADALLAAGGQESRALAAFAELAERRRVRRVAQGAVEIDIPEVRPWLDAGRIRIDQVPATRFSGVIREFMLLAGEAAARWAFERALPFPFYGQEAPGEAGELPPGLAGEFAKRRLMRGGVSGPSPSAHRGLGLPFYAQATSPLRRYQDLLGHMQIRAVLEGRRPLDADEVSRRCAMAQAASAATRQAERASDQHWALAYLLQNPGWSGEGIVVGLAGQGWAQVYIPALGLETRLRPARERGLNEAFALKPARIDLAKLEAAFEEA